MVSAERGASLPARLPDTFKSHLASVLFHLAAVGVVVLVTPRAGEKREEVIEVEIAVTKERPAPEPEPEIPPELVEPPKTARVPPRPDRVPDEVKVKKVKEEARPLAPAGPEPPPDLASFEAPFSISMEATVEGGAGIVVAVAPRGPGNVFAEPERPGPSGFGDSLPPPGVKVSSWWEITEEPEPLNDRDFKPVYPPEAKGSGLEGVVVVELLIDSRGRVTRARVVRGAGHGFNESALAYCRRLRFRPAKANKVAVASRIEWEVRFRLHNE